MLKLLGYFMILGVYLMCGKLLGLSILRHLWLRLMDRLVNLMGELGLQGVVVIWHRLLGIGHDIALHRLLKREIFLLLVVLVHCC